MLTVMEGNDEEDDFEDEWRYTSIVKGGSILLVPTSEIHYISRPLCDRPDSYDQHYLIIKPNKVDMNKKSVQEIKDDGENMDNIVSPEFNFKTRIGLWHYKKI